MLGLAPFRVKLDANRAQAVQATVTEFQLSTGQRAAQRKNFDQFLKMREQENEAARREVISPVKYIVRLDLDNPSNIQYLSSRNFNRLP